MLESDLPVLKRPLFYDLLVCYGTNRVDSRYPGTVYFLCQEIKFLVTAKADQDPDPHWFRIRIENNADPQHWFLTVFFR